MEEIKKCEVCGIIIPPSYQNLLCDEHYASVENKHNQPVSDSGIKDPNYQENPQMEDKEQWMANIGQFQRSGVLLWKDTRWMYNFVKDYCLARVQRHPQYPKFIWKPKIVDVGCGSGIGANVLSQEADFVWGIDKNSTSIKFAKEAFERVKNGIYYSSQLTYDNIDIMEDNRETMKFDVVTAIEIIEHIADARGFIERIIKKFDKRNSDDPTEYFISTPNRNNDSIQNDKPKNPYHVREWTSSEMLDFLSEYFGSIKFMNAKGVEIPEEEYRTTTHTPLLILCKNPKI